MFLGIPLVEWFGYLASAVVAVSLTMSSILRLRWANLAGSALFSAYGFSIGALPVALLNLFIVLVNLYYLYRIYREKADFRIMSLSGSEEYLTHFLECYRQDIRKFFPSFEYSPAEGRSAYYLVKNAAVIGVLVGRRIEGAACLIELDYVEPRFRDFKMGSFLYGRTDFFLSQGFRSLKAPSSGGAHDRYLERMGFVRSGGEYVKAL